MVVSGLLISTVCSGPTSSVSLTRSKARKKKYVNVSILSQSPNRRQRNNKGKTLILTLHYVQCKISGLSAPTVY